MGMVRVEKFTNWSELWIWSEIFEVQGWMFLGNCVDGDPGLLPFAVVKLQNL